MRVKILRLKFGEGDLRGSRVKWDVHDVTAQQRFKHMSGGGRREGKSIFPLVLISFL